MIKSRALLLDLDGTMVDTDPLHMAAYNSLLAPMNRSVDIEYYKLNIMGFGAEEIMTGLFPEADPSTYQGLSDEKERLFRSYLTELTPTAGLERLLDWAEAVGWRRAVVTNAPRPNAEQMLAGLGLADRFDAVVIAEELEFGKPHPHPYELAAELCGVDPSNCVAFEDSLAGVASASGAGALTYGMLTALSETQLLEAGADGVLSDFAEQGLWDRLARLAGVAAPAPTQAP